MSYYAYTAETVDSRVIRDIGTLTDGGIFPGLFIIF